MSSSSDSNYADACRAQKRRRTLIIGEVVRRRRAAVVAVTLLKQASGPQGPKLHISDEAFSWSAHVDYLTGAAFKRRYRMDVASFNKLKDKIAPHLPEISEEMARVNRKAGPVSHEVVLAITLRYLAGATMDDLLRPVQASSAPI